MKNYLALLFLCVSGLFAFEVDGIAYNVLFEQIAVEVIGKNPLYSGSVSIPATVDYNGQTYSVKAISQSAFAGCSGLTSITIPNSVTSIGARAFKYCSGLTSVTIPDSVPSIGEDTFLGCSGLTSVTIPNSVTSIGVAAFMDCTGLTSITIPNSVTSIGVAAFWDCTGLTSVAISNSVIAINNTTFYNCSSLTSVIIPSSVRTIGESAFAGCISLTSLTIPYQVTSISTWAFNNCPGLTSITCLATTPPQLGPNVFYGTSNAIPLFVPYVSLYQAAAQWNLFNIVPTRFDADGIAYLITGQNQVTVLPKNPGYSGSVSIPATVNYTGITHSVTSIAEKAFYQCYYLTGVTIPNSLVSIGNEAFRSCLGLTSVTMSNSVTTLGNLAFGNCPGLTSVTLSNSLTSMGYSAFSGCSGLTSMTIPGSVTSIGYQAFQLCNKLTAFYVESSNPNYSALDGVIYNKTKSLLVCYPPGKNGSFEIPNSVTSIGDGAFSSCYGLTSVIMPNSVISINESAFSNCRGLTNVIMPNSLKSIGNNAFMSCNGLTGVTISSSVTTIGQMAFAHCNGLTSVTCLVDTPPQLSYSVFFYITGLDTIPLYVPQNSVALYQAAPQWNAFNIQVASDIDDNQLAVKELSLAQNYPNPFNPVTAISYQLSAMSDVRLMIYNTKGELVKTLVNGNLPAGRYSVNFDGAGINSGVYFYKLEADGKNIVKRMLMVK